MDPIRMIRKENLQENDDAKGNSDEQAGNQETGSPKEVERQNPIDELLEERDLLEDPRNEEENNEDGSDASKSLFEDIEMEE